MLLAYIIGAIAWIVFNIVFYTRQKRRIQHKCKVQQENAYEALETERLMKIYKEIPALRMAALNSFNDDSDRQLDLRLGSANPGFQLNRAKVEASLRFKPLPKFLSRI
uniref:LemA family protein n=1 Tax=Syphacia muris TaxID=451379 RepID=A0A0N5B1F7_9BILA